MKQKGNLILKAVSENSEVIQNIDPIKKEVTIKTTGGVIQVDYPMREDALLWDEFNPNLYRLYVNIDGSKFKDSKEIVFGMREFKANGTRFEINQRPVFLRGTLECAIFPKTGYPPTNTEEWKRIIGICKDHGLNHMRFHSWCPPEAAFVAADELGFYFQV